MWGIGEGGVYASLGSEIQWLRCNTCYSIVIDCCCQCMLLWYYCLKLKIETYVNIDKHVLYSVAASITLYVEVHCVLSRSNPKHLAFWNEKCSKYSISYRRSDTKSECLLLYSVVYIFLMVGPIAQYSDWLRVWRSEIESRWGRDFPPSQTDPRAHPASCKMGTGSFPGVKCGWGMLLTTHPLLVPVSWKSRAIPLPTLWATPGL